MVTVIDAPREEPTPQQRVAAAFRQFVWLKASIDDFSREQAKAKAFLLQHLEDEGEFDDKGHAWFDFPEPVEGYARMQRQRRVSQKLDEQQAEELLSRKGLRDRAYKTIEVLDEDAIMGMLYTGELTEADIEAMFPQSVTFAFVPVKT